MHVAGRLAASAEPWPPIARNAPIIRAVTSRRIVASRTFIDCCLTPLERHCQDEDRKQREER